MHYPNLNPNPGPNSNPIATSNPIFEEISSVQFCCTCVSIAREKQKHTTHGLTNNDVQLSPERRSASHYFSLFNDTTSFLSVPFSLSVYLPVFLSLSVSLSLCLSLPYPFSFLFFFFLSPSLLLFIQALPSLSHSLFHSLSISLSLHCLSFMKSSPFSPNLSPLPFFLYRPSHIA